MKAQEDKNNTKLLSIEECRKELGEDGKLMSDKQIEAFRDALYALVEGGLDMYLHTIVSKEV